MKKVPAERRKSAREPKDHTVLYTAAYAAVGACWILVSDKLALAGGPPHAMFMWSIGKGLLYVAITSWLLYAMMRRNARELRELNQGLERRVEERTRELEAVNEELSAFSYSVSHDLRAPLRAINGFSQILREDCFDKLGPEGQDHLNRISAATMRMSALIDGLLDLSRAARIELSVEQVPLSEIAEGIAADLRQKEPERNVEFQIARGIVVRGDTRLLTTLLGNLLENAWKFTSTREKGEIRFGVLEVEGRTAYVVEDNGVGFGKEDAGRLFRPFQRLTSAAGFPGEGIGLATVRRIAQRHGGECWCEGEDGRGARFFFTVH